MKRLAYTLAGVICLLASGSSGAAADRSGDLVLSIWRGSGSTRNLDLALVSAAGGAPRFLTHVAVDDHSPSWSPRGDRIVFVRRGAERGGIYILRLSGATTIRLTHGPLEGAPAFSPDGTQIAFSRYAQIFVMRADGRGQRRVARTRWAPRQLSWSADGRRLLYGDEGTLRTLDVATGAVTRLGVSGFRPAVSTDRTRIAYMASGGVGPYYRDLNWGVYVADSNGANAERVVAGQFGPLSWAPDGSRLLATNGLELAFVDLGAKTLTRLPHRGSGGAFRP